MLIGTAALVRINSCLAAGWLECYTTPMPLPSDDDCCNCSEPIEVDLVITISTLTKWCEPYVFIHRCPPEAFQVTLPDGTSRQATEEELHAYLTELAAPLN